jgi:hypothetical protein
MTPIAAAAASAPSGVVDKQFDIAPAAVFLLGCGFLRRPPRGHGPQAMSLGIVSISRTLGKRIPRLILLKGSRGE